MDKWIQRGLDIWRVHREKLMYLIFGGLTTVVNYAVYFACTRALAQTELAANVVAWIAAVLFAFVTNKLWVFESKAKGGAAVLRELGAFAAARVLSLLLEMGILFVFVTMWKLWDLPVKLGANVLVVVMNYFASKWFIFKGKGENKEEKTMGETQNKTIYDLMHRRSYRAFQPTALKQEELATIVECALHAPSARNEQPWHVTVIRSKQVIDGISAAMADVMRASGDEGAVSRANDPNFSSFHHAPCVIMLSGPEDARFRVSDCGGMAQTVALAAQAMGIGSVIVASMLPVFQGPAAAQLMERLQIPAGYVPTLTVALGYPACDEPSAPERKADTVTYID